jgi:hypothetical protein
MVTERILGADGLHHTQVWRSIDGIDKPTTLFVVMEKDSKYRLIDIYPISKQPAYQQMANVCILYWPAREVAGMVKIESLLPPRERTVRQQPEYGELEPAIKEWIDGLADK